MFEKLFVLTIPVKNRGRGFREERTRGLEVGKKVSRSKNYSSNKSEEKISRGPISSESKVEEKEPRYQKKNLEG